MLAGVVLLGLELAGEANLVPEAGGLGALELAVDVGDAMDGFHFRNVLRVGLELTVQKDLVAVIALVLAAGPVFVGLSVEV